MEEKKRMKALKVPLQDILSILSEKFDEGYDYVDFEIIIGGRSDMVNVITKDEYMSDLPDSSLPSDLQDIID